MASHSNLESESLSAMSQAATSIPQLGATPSVPGAGVVRSSAGTDATPVRLGLMEDRLRADFRSAVGTIHRWMEMDSVRIRVFGAQARFISILFLFLVMLPVWFLAYSVAGPRQLSLEMRGFDNGTQPANPSFQRAVRGHSDAGADPSAPFEDRPLSQAEIDTIHKQIEELEMTVRTLKVSTERLKRLIAESPASDSSVVVNSTASDGSRLPPIPLPTDRVKASHPVSVPGQLSPSANVLESPGSKESDFVGVTDAPGSEAEDVRSPE
jgi:hypothetical protein